MGQVIIALLRKTAIGTAESGRAVAVETPPSPTGIHFFLFAPEFAASTQEKTQKASLSSI